MRLKPSLRRAAAVAGAAFAVTLVASACTTTKLTAGRATVTVTESHAASTPRTSAPATTAHPTSTPTPTPTPTRPVHVSLLENDGGVYGVGMPIIAWFDVAPTDAHAFVKATSVTVNGKPATGAWYFEQTAHQGSALEAHFRPEHYWPAHAKIFMNLPLKGRSAGPGLSYDDSLTLSISTGAATIATVDANTLQMTVQSDGKVYGVFPVSLGAANTPTARGIKVVMEQGLDISMRGPGYYDPHVKWTQRLTYGGEYLHSAPWNVANIGHVSTSNGCTNLLPSDAENLFHFMHIGDVVVYPNANGPQMRLGDGYGGWNVPWSQWLTGGALRTT